jgi:hypothetical protein
MMPQAKTFLKLSHSDMKLGTELDDSAAAAFTLLRNNQTTVN